MPARIELSLEDVAAMVTAYFSRSLRDIAVERGISTNTVRARLLEAGVQMDRRRSISAKASGRRSPRRGARVSEESRERMRLAAKLRPPRPDGPWSARSKAERRAARPPPRTPQERAEIERLRQTCKRFLRRTLSAAGLTKSTPTQQALGYSAAELQAHLGLILPDHEVDHIVPVVEFFRRGIFDPAVINALVNLQPLSSDANKRKGAKLPPNAEEIIRACLMAPERGC